MNTANDLFECRLVLFDQKLFSEKQCASRRSRRRKNEEIKIEKKTFGFDLF